VLNITSTAFYDVSLDDSTATFNFNSHDLAGTVVSRGGGILSDVDITADMANSSSDLTATSSSGLVGSEESDLGFPLHPECAIQTYADWYFLHGIFG
jgi:hypothetical protein